MVVKQSVSLFCRWWESDFLLSFERLLDKFETVFVYQNTKKHYLHITRFCYTLRLSRKFLLFTGLYSISSGIWLQLVKSVKNVLLLAKYIISNQGSMERKSLNDIIDVALNNEK